MKTKIAHNSVNIEFLGKISEFRNHQFRNLKNRFFDKFSLKTKIAHNSVNIGFLGKISEFRDHIFQNLKIDF